MTDLAVLAVAFGAIPLGAIVLDSFRGWIAAHRDLAWSGLAGVLVFLGLAHAMAYVLETKPFLFDGSSEIGSILFLAAGLSFGGVLGWVLFEKPFIRTEPLRVVWAATAFLALHSAGDGLVLGRSFVGPGFPIVSIDFVTMSATIIHRFVEGAIVLVPAFAGALRVRSSFLLLTVSLAAIPAAFLPGFLAGAMGIAAGGGVARTLSTFLASMEATLALLLVVRGFVPILISERGPRWILWVLTGFIGISVVHFLVE
ncbi:MAG: hypothetical protein E6K19_03590 [Methanobacteriota archaeon]|nr:MAG: hypothetical protein E6K19_03590 [Euryarchaeota archaeon]